MLRGALRFEVENKKAILDDNEQGYFVDFYDNDVKLGRVEYYGKDASYAESACENYVYDIFTRDEVLKHVIQLELKL